MGQTLSSPATEKTSSEGSNSRFHYGISEVQGWRISMEDAHTTILSLDGDDVDGSNSFFAVYDGHGGGGVAKFAGENVHKRLLTEETYKEKDYPAALKRAFLGTDEDLLANPATARDPSGCTAVASLISGDKIYVANAGDSRSVISVKGVVKPLSFDHKPTNDSEKVRITGAGGYVEYGRVNGNLALSRALGDFDFKKNYSMTPETQIITADPDITCHTITEEDEFLVLACDGIWDCLTSQQVVDFIRLEVSEGKSLTQICEDMCDHCLAPDTSSGAGIGCDNMTILIVAILHGRTKEEWAQWITDRVKNNYGYSTPTTLPYLYAPSRRSAFKARQEQHERRLAQYKDDPNPGLGAFTRILGSNGGISFQPGGAIMSDSGDLMFGKEEDTDSEDSGDDQIPASFKAQLDALRRSMDDESADVEMGSEETHKADAETTPEPASPTTEASTAAVALPNGDATAPIPTVEESAKPLSAEATSAMATA
ncbi:phosphatase 2C-like domain-containing protein [Mycena floridula]|nr:phosphatase 2C-like domain-containing protein [Mycena floridula]